MLPSSGAGLADLERTGQLQRFVTEYLERYREAFAGVRYFSYRDEQVALPAGVRLFPNQSRWRRLYGVCLPWLARSAMRDVSVFRVFQINGCHPAILARWLYGVPYVVTYGYDYCAVLKSEGAWWPRRLLMRFRESLGVRYAAQIIVTTSALRKTLLDRGVPAQKLTWIPNGVNTTTFCPPRVPEPRTGLRLLFVGRMTAQKNLTVLVEATACQAGLGAGVILRMVGDGPRVPALHRLMDRCPVAAWIEPTIPNECLPAVYRWADVFVLPSHVEGHPKALLEAMACGLACIGNRAAGIEGLLQHGRNGLLFDGTVGDLSNQIARLVADRRLREQLGRHARDDVLAHHDIARTVPREITLLKSTAAGEGA